MPEEIACAQEEFIGVAFKADAARADCQDGSGESLRLGVKRDGVQAEDVAGLQQRLWLAVERRDHLGAQEALAAGASAILRGRYGLTPLMHAVQRRDSGCAKALAPSLQLFATTWFIEEWLQVDADHKMESYRIISRPAPEDLLNVFDAYYVRNAQGRWLGGPKTKAHYQALAWHVNFGDAVSFLSEEAARAAVEANGPGAYNLMKTSCVFTEVLQGGPGGEPGVFVDQVAAGIAAACKARDIRASMNAEAEARSKASSDAAPRASSKRSNAL